MSEKPKLEVMSESESREFDVISHATMLGREEKIPAINWGRFIRYVLPVIISYIIAFMLKKEP